MLITLLTILFGSLFAKGGDMDINRKTAYRTLMEIDQKNAYSNLSLNHNIRMYRPDSPGFVRELVYGVLENRYYLDYIIDELAVKGLKSVKKSELNILRLALYQIIFLDMVPDYAAVDESVELSKEESKGKAAFINGVLRAFLRKRDSIELPDREKDEIYYLSVKYSYEPWIIKIWLEQYTIEEVEALLAAGNAKAPLVCRVNRTKIGVEEFISCMRSRGFGAEKSARAEAAVILEGTDILASAEYAEGLFSVQDEASQICVGILDPQPGQQVFDVCAAPGGKAMAIAECLKGTGLVTASDIYTRKVQQMEKEITRLGLRNIMVHAMDATRVEESMLAAADCVLVDAPCSGLGVVRRKPEIKFKKFTEEIRNLPVLQGKILEASSGYVKPGGVLVYSTCTISFNENDRVVNSFLREHPEFAEEKRVQLLPSTDDTDGFFICRMKRSM